VQLYECPPGERAAKVHDLRTGRQTARDAADLGCSWCPDKTPTLYVIDSVTGMGQRPSGTQADVCLYTDGSTGPQPSLPSGCSVILTVGGTLISKHRFPVRASGNNFLAELVALLAAVLSVPEDWDLVVRTDSLAAIFAVNNSRDRNWADGSYLAAYHLTQTHRILSAARPVMNNLRAVLKARTGRVSLIHVKAHSGNGDVHSK